jgi:NAD-dependent deacetylase
MQAHMRLAARMREAGSVVALTGAGISVPSGIPDFRSPGSGVWQRVDPMEVAHIDAFRKDPARFWRFYAERFASLQDKLPNDAHRALVSLEANGILDAVITQNIDMLQREAGTKRLIEVHGSIACCRCLGCPGQISLAELPARMAADSQRVPRCADCGAPLKPDVVLFGELLPEQAMAQARELCAQADLLLCVGSSLEVYPVAELPLMTHRAGGTVAIITQGPTPLDGLASERLHGDVVDELRALRAALEDARDSG